MMRLVKNYLMILPFAIYVSNAVNGYYGVTMASLDAPHVVCTELNSDHLPTANLEDLYSENEI